MEKSLKASLLTACSPIGVGILLTAMLVVSGWLQLPALRDAVTMLPVLYGFSLETSWAYLIFAPLFNMLDMLSFLSSSQHKSVMLTLLLAPTLLSLALTMGKPWRQRLLAAAKYFFLSIIVLLALYAVAALAPRPMGALKVQQRDAVLVDFHSHTNHSWDANSLFTAERNRIWHAKSGFHAAFITDHKTFAGIEEGKKRNPAMAKDGVLLLDGIEAAYHDSAHVMALCATRKSAEEETFNWSPRAGHTGCEPLLVQATPGPVQDLAQTHAAGKGVLAIEIHDAAPAGLEELKHRDFLIKQAKKMNIAVVYGSDNHGWAFAASAWSVLHISDWQHMNADQLALAITDKIRQQGFEAVQVVERNILPSATSWAEHVLMPVRLIWRMLSTISHAERASWLLWVWLMVLFFYRKQHLLSKGEKLA